MNIDLLHIEVSTQRTSWPAFAINKFVYFPWIQYTHALIPYIGFNHIHLIWRVFQSNMLVYFRPFQGLVFRYSCHLLCFPFPFLRIYIPNFTIAKALGQCFESFLILQHKESEGIRSFLREDNIIAFSN
jgi:hypothetical protein